MLFVLYIKREIVFKIFGINQTMMLRVSKPRYLKEILTGRDVSSWLNVHRNIPCWPCQRWNQFLLTQCTVKIETHSSLTQRVLNKGLKNEVKIPIMLRQRGIHAFILNTYFCVAKLLPSAQSEIQVSYTSSLYTCILYIRIVQQYTWIINRPPAKRPLFYQLCTYVTSQWKK